MIVNHRYHCHTNFKSNSKNSIVKILNLYTIILSTHLYHFFPVAINYLQCIHCLLHYVTKLCKSFVELFFITEQKEVKNQSTKEQWHPFLILFEGFSGVQSPLNRQTPLVRLLGMIKSISMAQQMD